MSGFSRSVWGFEEGFQDGVQGNHHLLEAFHILHKTVNGEGVQKFFFCALLCRCNLGPDVIEGWASLDVSLVNCRATWAALSWHMAVHFKC